MGFTCGHKMDAYNDLVKMEVELRQSAKIFPSFKDHGHSQ